MLIGTAVDGRVAVSAVAGLDPSKVPQQCLWRFPLPQEQMALRELVADLEDISGCALVIVRLGMPCCLGTYEAHSPLAQFLAQSCRAIEED